MAVKRWNNFDRVENKKKNFIERRNNRDSPYLQWARGSTCKEKLKGKSTSK